MPTHGQTKTMTLTKMPRRHVVRVMGTGRRKSIMTMCKQRVKVRVGPHTFRSFKDLETELMAKWVDDAPGKTRKVVLRWDGPKGHWVFHGYKSGRG